MIIVIGLSRGQMAVARIIARKELKYVFSNEGIDIPITKEETINDLMKNLEVKE